MVSTIVSEVNTAGDGIFDPHVVARLHVSRSSRRWCRAQKNPGADNKIFRFNCLKGFMLFLRGWKLYIGE